MHEYDPRDEAELDAYVAAVSDGHNGNADATHIDVPDFAVEVGDDNGFVRKPLTPEILAIAHGCTVAHAAKALYRFPVELLPEPIRGFVGVGAKALDCDPSYIATPLLVAAASAIGNTRQIQLETHMDRASRDLGGDRRRIGDGEVPVRWSWRCVPCGGDNAGYSKTRQRHVSSTRPNCRLGRTRPRPIALANVPNRPSRASTASCPTLPSRRSPTA